MSKKYDKRDSQSKPEKAPFQKQNDDFPDFDIAKNLKGALPREELQNLFSVRVTNLQDVVKSDLLEFFKDYEIADIHIPWEYGRKTDDGKPVLKGIAFVRFKEEKDPEEAAKTFDKTELKGKIVGVSRTNETYAKPSYSSRDRGRSHYKGSNYRPNYYKRDTDYRKQDIDRQGGYRPNREDYSDDYYTHHSSRGQQSYSRPFQYDRARYNNRHDPQRYPEDSYPKRDRDIEPYENYDRRDFHGPGRAYQPDQSGFRDNYNNYGQRSNYSNGDGAYPISENKRRRVTSYESNNRDGYQNHRNYQRDQGYHDNGPSYGYSNNVAPGNARGTYERRTPKPYQNNRSEKGY